MSDQSVKWTAASKYGGAGLVIGTILGLAGFVRAGSEFPATTDTVPVVVNVLASAVIGSFAGILLYLLSGIRRKGRRGHYAAWMFAVGIAGILLVLPDVFTKREWWNIPLAFLFGGAIGLGLGVVARQVQGHWW